MLHLSGSELEIALKLLHHDSPAIIYPDRRTIGSTGWRYLKLQLRLWRPQARRSPLIVGNNCFWVGRNTGWVGGGTQNSIFHLTQRNFCCCYYKQRNRICVLPRLEHSQNGISANWWITVLVDWYVWDSMDLPRYFWIFNIHSDSINGWIRRRGKHKL